MGTTEIIEMTNADPAFYPQIGPFLARHDVHIALGGVPWDEPTKTWLVLRDADGVIAFCAVNQKPRRTALESLFVEPGRPGHTTAARRFIAAAVQRFGHDRDLHAVVRHHLAPAHQKAGFHPATATTNFTTLVRPATIRKTTSA